MTGTIPRMKFAQIDESLVDERAQLAQKASTVLGYTRMAKALAVPGALLFTLRKLEMEPLSMRGVAEYKRKQARPGMWSGTRNQIIRVVFTTTGLVGLLISLAKVIAGSVTAQPIAFAFGVCMVFAGIATFVWSDEVGAGRRITKKWVRHSILEYSKLGNIPEFALIRAVALKETLPDSKLFVDHLYEEREELIPTRDPFLVVELGDETYYIDVWDEKEYEARL